MSMRRIAMHWSAGGIMEKRPTAVWFTFGYAILWGCFSMLAASLGLYPSALGAPLGAIMGASTAVLGFFVLQRDAGAAWLLVGTALLDALSRTLQDHRSVILMPALLGVFALWAACCLKTVPADCSDV